MYALYIQRHVTIDSLLLHIRVCITRGGGELSDTKSALVSSAVDQFAAALFRENRIKVPP